MPKPVVRNPNKLVVTSGFGRAPLRDSIVLVLKQPHSTVEIVDDNNKVVAKRDTLGKWTIVNAEKALEQTYQAFIEHQAQDRARENDKQPRKPEQDKRSLSL